MRIPPLGRLLHDARIQAALRAASSRRMTVRSRVRPNRGPGGVSSLICRNSNSRSISYSSASKPREALQARGRGCDWRRAQSPSSPPRKKTCHASDIGRTNAAEKFSLGANRGRAGWLASLMGGAAIALVPRPPSVGANRASRPCQCRCAAARQQTQLPRPVAICSIYRGSRS